MVSDMTFTDFPSKHNDMNSVLGAVGLSETALRCETLVCFHQNRLYHIP
jgi:hypothetical protein